MNEAVIKHIKGMTYTIIFNPDRLTVFCLPVSRAMASRIKMVINTVMLPGKMDKRRSETIRLKRSGRSMIRCCWMFLERHKRPEGKDIAKGQ